MRKIILTTLNARFSHTSIGLRYLYANLRELQELTSIQEYVINESIPEIAEKVLLSHPAIIGIGVYIWNALDVSNLVNVIKKVAPGTIIVLGGPEVSHLPLRVDFSQADYIIQGEAEDAFYELCRSLLDNTPPSQRIIKSEYADLSKIALPYKYYTDTDVRDRVIYVEASRGCPFTCEFCLSSIDKKVRNFNIDIILQEFEILWQRGARNFKFIDRTFNLNSVTTNRILDYFLIKEPPYHVHFEMIPEHFPESIKQKLTLFPPASLQLEIGIQTLNTAIAESINRKLNFEKIKKNLNFLETQTKAHLHVDLIVGLPGESIESFGNNLNILAALTGSEIQIGILKKLSGTSISRHDEEHTMIFSDLPPYEILQNDLISFTMMQKMKRFSRFWDLTYNSGNFNKTIRLLWPNGDVFSEFFNFSDWIYSQTLSTWQIALNRIAELLFNYLSEIKKLDKTEVADTIVQDILKIQGRMLPGFLKDHASAIPDLKKRELTNLNKRQLKHL